eukprot:g1698.t1
MGQSKDRKRKKSGDSGGGSGGRKGSAASGDGGGKRKKTKGGSSGGGGSSKADKPRVPVCVSFNDNVSDAQLALSDDRMVVVGRKGYRMILATHGAGDGGWFCEFAIEEPPSGQSGRPAPGHLPAPHTRLGWSTVEADQQAPVGYDVHSYSYASKTGKRGHRSRLNAYGESYGPGDVVGCFIEVSEHPRIVPPPAAAAASAGVSGDGSNSNGAGGAPGTTTSSQSGDRGGTATAAAAGSSSSSSSSSMAAGEPTTHVTLRFYKNGLPQGVAFDDHPAEEGPYFPAASTYMGAKVRFNPGPAFAFPPAELDIDGLQPFVRPQPEQEPGQEHGQSGHAEAATSGKQHPTKY